MSEIQSPQTLAQFLRLLLRSFLSGLRWKLLLAAAVAVATWVLHTYLLVGPNGGFAPGTSAFLDQVLALRDRVFSGTLFWTLLATLVTMTVVRVVRTGLRRTARAVTETPGWLWAAIRDSGKLARPLLLCGGAALALLFGTILGHRLLVLQLALLGLGALVARQQSVSWTALRLAWADGQRLLKRDDPGALDAAWLGIGTLGLTLGLFGAALQPFAPYGGLVGVVLLLGVMVAWLARTFTRPGAGTLLILLILLGVLALAVVPAFADDGGWAEGGSTLAGWLRSPGAGRAMAMGLLPALGASLGVLAGSMAGGVAGALAGTGLAEPSIPAGRRKREDAPAPAGAATTQAPATTKPGQQPPPARSAPAAKQAAKARTAPPRTQAEAGTPPETPGRAGAETRPGSGTATPGPSKRPDLPTAEDVEEALGEGETPSPHPSTQAEQPRADAPRQAAKPTRPGAEQAAKPTPTAEGPPSQPQAKQARPEVDPSTQTEKPSGTEHPPSQQAARPTPDLAKTPPGGLPPITPPAAAAAATATAPPWQLEVVRGPEIGQRYPLADETHLGRATEMDVRLRDRKVSRQHALIRREGTVLQIADLGSSNGTYVNEERITAPTRLHPGDTVRLGDTEMVVVG